MATLKGKTSAGFTYEIDDQALNDMELLETISEVDENIMALPKVIGKVLGARQKAAFYDFYRDESGRVPVDKVSAAFVEIMNGSKQGKN